MDIDEIWKYLGSFGKYQKRIYLLICLTTFSCAFHTLGIIFMSALPEHRCAIPGVENDTYEIQGDFHQSLVNNYIPYEQSTGYDSCFVYDKPYNLTSANKTRPSNATSESCYEWVFDHSVFTTTVTEEMNLVCENLVQRSHLPMFYILGAMFGSFGIGTLSDWFGRKKLLYITIIVQLIVGNVAAWVTSFTALALCRFVLGISGVGGFLTGFSLGMELVAPSKRVWTGIVIEIFYTFGEMLLAAIAYFIRDWRYLQLAISLPAVLFLPYWWCVVSLVYYGLTLNSGYLYGHLHLNFFFSVLTESLAYCICIPLLDRLGRRTLHCSAMLISGAACCSTILSVLYLSSEQQWVTTTLAMVGKLGASAAFAVVFIYSSEIFPTVVRSGGVGLGSMFARIGALAAPYIADLGILIGGSLGMGLPLIVFGLGSITAGLLALTLPETLNRPLPETIEDAVNLGRKVPRYRDRKVNGLLVELSVLDSENAVNDPDVKFKWDY